MCGIVGLWNPNDPDPLTRARAMASTIVHRGPDDAGFHATDGLAIGMRRLSIIDLAGGHQPIFNEDGSLAIVFNGEIYNHAEIRASLEARGHRFATRCDTEVIVHAFEEHGADCVHLFNGMFAFAIWDARTRSLFLARDRMGVKPLYWTWDGTRFAFASEMKALVASGVVAKRLDERALWHYLTFGYVPGEAAIWDGIRKLPPAHRLTLTPRGGDPVVERYWDIPGPAPEELTTAQRDEKFAELFEDAVRRRLIADVPVGILLSGGLDSSAVAAVVRKVHDGPVSTFSVAFRDGGVADESGYARLMARAIGADHHEIFIGEEEFSAFLPEFAWFADEPLSDSASIALYHVSQLARQHVKVVLSGEGSDELLGGYAFEETLRYVRQRERLARRSRPLRQLTPSWLASLVLARAPESRLARLLAHEDEVLRLLAPNMTRVMSSREKRRLWPAGPRFEDSMEVVRRVYDRAPAGTTLSRILYAYSQDWLVEDLLMKADKMTMANSIELRVPFLDYRLVEWISRQDDASKLRLDESGAATRKVLLRRYASGRLPPEIVERPKVGFATPTMEWVRTDHNGFRSRALGRPGAWVRDRFSPKVIDEIAHGAGFDRRATAQAWLLIVLENWAQRWL
jgi:asparagine synthase (glutamine-hydrolysing)